MDSFKLYDQAKIATYVKPRAGEQKLGETIQCSTLDKLHQSKAKFVLLGIPEDIGVRSNYGIGGTKTAWPATLRAFLNLQSNSFLTGEEIVLLGHFEIAEPELNEINVLRNKVRQIDSLVHPIIQMIIDAGKIPIIIGGGHNNAYPIIQGVSTSLNQKINVINIDAHADLRDTKEGRHSGNGFNYALQNGFLNEYRMFGLHQNYINKDLPAYVEANPNLKIAYFDNLIMNGDSIFNQWMNFIKDLAEPCGLEIDLDSIANILSSAVSPTGFALNDIRQILLSGQKQYRYLHICEGALKLDDGREDATIGKTIAYLISDFVKAN